MSDSPPISLSSVPIYGVQRYLLWFYLMAGHETHVVRWPRVSWGLLMPRSDGHALSQETPDSCYDVTAGHSGQ